MTEAKLPPEDSATSKADAMALLEEAEAEAAEAEALAAAARARARAARLRRQALAEAEAAEAADKQAPDADEGADDTVEIPMRRPMRKRPTRPSKPQNRNPGWPDGDAGCHHCRRLPKWPRSSSSAPLPGPAGTWCGKTVTPPSERSAP